MDWIQVDHNPLSGCQELDWIIQHIKGKGCHVTILKLTFTKNVYNIWGYRNDINFGNAIQTKHIEGKIIDTIMYIEVGPIGN
jgi:hypothetical protein